MFDGRENTAETAAILCPAAACVSDVRKKVDMCGKSINYVTSEPSCDLHL